MITLCDTAVLIPRSYLFLMPGNEACGKPLEILDYSSLLFHILFHPTYIFRFTFFGVGSRMTFQPANRSRGRKEKTADLLVPLKSENNIFVAIRYCRKLNSIGRALAFPLFLKMKLLKWKTLLQFALLSYTFDAKSHLALLMSLL